MAVCALPTLCIYSYIGKSMHALRCSITYAAMHDSMCTCAAATDDDHARGRGGLQSSDVTSHAVLLFRGPVVYHLTSLGARNAFSKLRGLYILLNKFRGPEMHFQSSGAYVTHTYKFRGLWRI
jgi:hypothetical protein